jgi:beta-phosphoglucomutase
MFDMDGVIVDTSKIHSEAFHQTFSEFSVDFEYDIWKGSSTREVIFSVFKDTTLSIPELEELVTRKQNLALLYLKSSTIDDLFFENAVDSLFAFAQISNLGLCTSAGRSSVEHILKIGGLNQVFSFVMTSNDISKSKPHPEIYLKGVKKFGVPAEECLVIEDSKNGLLAARSAGCQVIHFGDKNEKSLASLPFFEEIISVSSYRDLQRLLLK